jgi:hypothetical protein
MLRAMAPLRSWLICRCMIACRSAGTRWYQPARHSASWSFKDISKLLFGLCLRTMKAS